MANFQFLMRRTKARLTHSIYINIVLVITRSRDVLIRTGVLIWYFTKYLMADMIILLIHIDTYTHRCTVITLAKCKE